MTTPDNTVLPPEQKDAPTQTERLIELGREMLQLFHDSQERPFAEPTVGRRGAVALPSKRAGRILQLAFKQRFGHYPNPSAVATALEGLATDAMLEGPDFVLYTRVGKSDNGRVVLDLGADGGGLIEVEDGSWRLTEDVAVRFQRRDGTHALPAPRAGGEIELLRKFVNVESDEDFMLVASWAASALSPAGPYPVLIVQGEQGSAKSTTCEVLKRLVDPTRAPLRAAPRSTRDLAIAAEGNWVSCSTTSRSCQSGSPTRSVGSPQAAASEPARSTTTMRSGCSSSSGP
jgi:hypothetical protein